MKLKLTSLIFILAIGIAQAQINLNSGLVAYYPFNGDATDKSGYGNNGQPTGGCQWGTDRFGEPSKALFLDGSNLVTIPSSSSLDLHESLTLTVWFKSENLQGFNQLIYRGDPIPITDPYWIRTQDNFIKFERDYKAFNSPTLQFSIDVLNKQMYHFYVATYDSLDGKMKLYIDGNQVIEETHPGQFEYPTSTMFNNIGGIDNTPACNGFLDDIRIYNRALSSEEIQALYSENGWSGYSGNFIDSRDQHPYNWVRIGTQIWMAENLAYLPAVRPSSVGSDAEPYYYVYGYEGMDVIEAKANQNYKDYGVLYNLSAAKVVCPPGWHLPTDDEWKQLEMALGMTNAQADEPAWRGTDQGIQLKTTSGWYNNGNGTNTSGFSALPGGFRGNYGIFYGVGYGGLWWSSTEGSTTQAWYRHLKYDDSGGGRGYNLKEWGLSVRCVKDEPNTTTAPASIFGIITNSVTRLPVQGAIVKTLTYQSTTTDAYGNYVLKVPYGYGYKLNVLSPTFETVTITDIHVPLSNPTKEVNIQLNPSAIDPGIVKVSPDPNPFTSTVPQGGVLHRYYKIINKNSGNPLPMIPVSVTGDNYSKTFTTDEKGIVDITIQSNEIGNGEIGSEEVFSIVSVNNVSLETTWVFTAKITPRIYSRYFDDKNYYKLGLNLGGKIPGIKREVGGVTTLNVNESNSLLPTDIQIDRHVSTTGQIEFKKSPPWMTSMKMIDIDTKASIGVVGIKEDGYIFPYISENEKQAIVKFFLFGGERNEFLDHTLMRLVTLMELLYPDNTTLHDAYISDAVGVEVVANAKAEAFAGYQANKNIKFGLFGSAGIEANAGFKFKFNDLENQLENSFHLTGKINGEIGGGVKVINHEGPEWLKTKAKLRFIDAELSRGLTFTAILDYSDITKIKEYKLTFLSRNFGEKWEEEIEYRITGDQVVYAIARLTDEITQITNASSSGMDINVGTSTFSTIIYKVFTLLNEFQTSPSGEAAISYKIQRTNLKETQPIETEIKAISVLKVVVGAGGSFEEGEKMVIEEGKWIKFDHFINEEFQQTIPTVPVDFKTLIQNMINETPIWVRALMGDFTWLFKRPKDGLKSSNIYYVFNENGSSIDIPSSAIPNEVDSISVTSWSWYGDSPTLKSASLTSRQQSIAQKNRLRAEAIYGMQYGIGGFYQFEPYGMKLLDTCLLTIKYDPSELGNLDENSLGMYWEDKENKRWVYIGGEVDTANHSVTAPITHLSLFTLAPAMPYGEFGMHATPDSIYADSISITTIVSDSIFNNDHSLVSDGTLFNIGLSLGIVVTPDTDVPTEGIQIPVLNGRLTFQCKSHQLAGIAKVMVNSVEGSAFGSTEITYFDTIAPEEPVVIGAQLENTSVNLKWEANFEEDLAGYIIYYDTDTIFPYDGVHTVYGVSSPIIIGVDSLLSISGLLNDSLYYFAVSAYDASGNESSLSNFVKVKTNFTMTCYLLKFKQGWNIFSAPNYPDSLGIKYNTQPLIDRSSLIKIQDESGNSLEDWGIFGSWKNNIGNISPTEGYKIKISVEDSIEICGTPVNYPFAIPLKAGWNIVGYPQQIDFNGMNLVQQLAEKGTLIKVQDEAGNSIEDWGIFGSWQNNIGNFKAGEGYKIKVSADDTLWIYESYPKTSAILPELVTITHFQTAFQGNGIDHMNINLVGLPFNILTEGDELAVLDGSTCVGAIKLTSNHLQSQTVSIVTSATDNPEMAGFSEGNLFSLRMWDSRQNQELRLEPEIISGTSTFAKHETTVASLEKYAATGLEEIPGSDINEINCYPNPFSDEVTVEINLYKEAQVEVEVFNQLGQKVKNLAAGTQLNRGIHKIIWDGTNTGKVRITPGIYNVRLKIDDMVYYRKAIYTK